MAQQANQYYNGRQGNAIYYKLNEGYYIRSVPVLVKQTAATKIRSSNFAIASKAGRMFRFLLEPAIPFSKDKKMQNRFAGTFMKWLQLNTLQQLQPATDLPFVQSFQFNETCSLSERCKIPLSVIPVNDGLLQLHLPAFIPANSFAAPAQTNSINCIITTASCALQSGEENGSLTRQFMIPYSTTEIPEQIIKLPIAMPRGSLIIVAVALQYNIGKNGNYKPAAIRAFMPSGIIASMYV